MFSKRLKALIQALFLSAAFTICTYASLTIFNHLPSTPAGAHSTTASASAPAPSSCTSLYDPHCYFAGRITAITPSTQGSQIVQLALTTGSLAHYTANVAAEDHMPPLQIGDTASVQVVDNTVAGFLARNYQWTNPNPSGDVSAPASAAQGQMNNFWTTLNLSILAVMLGAVSLRIFFKHCHLVVSLLLSPFSLLALPTSQRVRA